MIMVKHKYLKVLIPIIINVVLFGAVTAITVIYMAGPKKNSKYLPNEKLIAMANDANRSFYDGNLVESLIHDMDFVNNTEQHTDVYGSLLADAYFRIGLVYAYFDDIPNSTKYNLKAYEMALHTKHYDHIISILTNIAGDYICLENFSKANEYNKKLLELDYDKEESLFFYYITLDESIQ